MSGMIKEKEVFTGAVTSSEDGRIQTGWVMKYEFSGGVPALMILMLNLTGCCRTTS